VPPFVLFERRTPRLAVVTLNNPARLNALHTEMVLGLHDVLDELAADSRCRVVIFTGAGRGFCSGLDLSEPAVGPTARGRTGSASGMRTQEFIASLVPKIIALPQPVIAAVNGPAVGGGFALAAASDLRIAGASASFCTQFIRLGVSGCDIGVSYTLPKLIGGARAAELIYTARRFDAYEAEHIGFVSEVVAEDDLLSRAEEIASVMLSYSPFAREMTKQVFRANQDAANVGAAIALENRTQVLAGSSGDFAEAVAARAEGRLPYWATERDADGH
jgi:enoyl-CoA hydratase